MRKEPKFQLQWSQFTYCIYNKIAHCQHKSGTNPGRLFAQTIKFLNVARNIFTNIFAVYFIYVQKCAYVCVHRSYDRGSQVTPKLWVLSVEMNSWLPSGADNLEAAPGFIQSCGTMVYTIALYRFTLIGRMKILAFLKTRPVGSVFFSIRNHGRPQNRSRHDVQEKISSPSRKGLLSIAQSVAKPLYRQSY
jgi:hypothetical protein